MQILKPAKLARGQKLGIIALSTPASILRSELRKRAYERIQTLFGLEVVEAPNIDKLMGHTAGSVSERVDSLHTFFANKDIHGIMAFWGGLNTHQILEYLDYDLIRRNPKVVVGYSDTTTLLTAIFQQAGLITFNGPAVVSFAKPNVPSETEYCFRDLLMAGVAEYTYPTSTAFSDNQWWVNDEMEFADNPGLKVYCQGKATGQLLGGNIGTLLLLAGTPYFPLMKDKILVVEDDEAEKPGTLDRFFTQLRHMGVYREIKGLIVGRFPRCVGFNENDSLEMILDEALAGYNFPVITEFDFGHTDPLLTIPIGAMATIDTSDQSGMIRLLEAVTV